MSSKPYFDLPPGPELAWRNRRVVAERLGWPAGALDACERIQKAHPGWDPWWGDATVRKPAGYYAQRDGYRHGEPSAYGATPEKLIEAIKKHPAWKWDWSVPCPPLARRAGE